MYASLLLPIPFCRLKGPLTYAVPDGMALRPGMVVLAPFGKGAHRAVVTVVDAAPPPGMEPTRVRMILSRDAGLDLSPERFALAEWIARTYRAPLLEVLRMFLPGLVWKDGLIDSAHEIIVLEDAPPAGTLEALRRAPKQRGAYEQLAAAKRIPASALAAMGIERATVQLLAKRGLLRIEEELPAKPELAILPTPVAATPAQEEAIETALAGDGYRGTLLFGVTGSGKTEVYLRTMETALTDGKSALFLVPEIALTPQTIARVEERFPGMVAVLHSGLTEHQRALAWSRIATGHARVLVGPRSALFAPLVNLGAIVIDEEHDTSYKQDTVPRYHARSVALEYARMLRIPILLGSATPSVETYAAALRGDLRRATLPERIAGVAPRIEVVDLREERKAGNRTLFSAALRDALQTTVAAGRQAILFLNRRGFSPSLHCPTCGKIEECAACDLARTLHRRRQSDASGRTQSGFVLLCHGCGSIVPVPSTCPSCGGRELETVGYGTQRVEEELAAILPTARIVRADRDSTRGAEAHGRIYDLVRNHEVDVLIGTQMIAKGLDLPAVDLVGILLADIGLTHPDFRATERSFALLMQVAGRAGRRGQPGRVLLQTYTPDAAAVQAAVGGDVEGFLNAELLLRQTFRYPPAAALVKLTTSLPSAQQAYEHLLLLKERLSPRAEHAKVDLLGPAPAVFVKRKGLFTYHLLLRGATHETIAPLLEELPPGVQIDIDPQETA